MLGNAGGVQSRALITGNLPAYTPTGTVPISDPTHIHSIPGVNDIVLYSEKKTEKGKYILSRIRNNDVHVMNKWAINRFSDRLISLYKEQV